MGELIYKPGFVFDNHLSRPVVTVQAQATYHSGRDTSRIPSVPILGLAPGGVYIAT